jgi:hypothetical protein
VVGRIVNLSGDPVPHVLLRLLEKPPRRSVDRSWIDRGAGTSDADGRFTFVDLASGLYRVDPIPPDGYLPVMEPDLVVEAPDRPPGCFAQVARIPEAGGSVDLLIVLLRPGRVRGIVLDATGRAAPDVRVRLQGFDSGQQGVHTDANCDVEGRFEIAAPPTRYRVRCVISPDSPLAATCRPLPVEFELREGELRELEPLRFGGDGCRVTGRVVDQQGSAFAGLDVLCWYAEEAAIPHDWSNELLRTTTDVTGAFRLDGLPACRVSVSVAPEGFLPGNEETNVLAWFLEPAELDLRREHDVDLPLIHATRNELFELEVTLTESLSRRARVELELLHPREPDAPPWVLRGRAELRSEAPGDQVRNRAFRWRCSTPHPPVVVRAITEEKGRRVVLAEKSLAPTRQSIAVSLP